MRRLATITAALSLAALPACVQPHSGSEGQAIREALPTADGVKIEVPDSAGYRAVGDLADYYVITRSLSRDLNGGAAWVLLLVHTIVQFPATSVDGATHTWGPWSDALDPAEWRLVVTALADGSYDWRFDGKSKTVAAADFTTVISGNAVPGAEPHRGQGTFLMDFDAAEEVDPIDNDGRGTVEIAYDLENRDDTPATLTMAIDSRDDLGNPVHFDYDYARNIDGSGDLVFGIHGDLDDEGGAAEDAIIRSRWLPTGAGRADVMVSDGDLGQGVTVTGSECWDESFGRVFYGDSAGWMATEGDEADCAFADQDLPDA